MVASARPLTLTVYCFIASAPFHGWGYCGEVEPLTFLRFHYWSYPLGWDYSHLPPFGF